jgi:hypothetical protein
MCSGVLRGGTANAIRTFPVQVSSTTTATSNFAKLANIQQHSQQCDYHDQKYREHNRAFRDVVKCVVWPSLTDELIHLVPHSDII